MADARALEVGQEEKKTILLQLEHQMALYDAQGAYVMELQTQLQQQVSTTTTTSLCTRKITSSLQRDVTAEEVAVHAATSTELQGLQKQVLLRRNLTQTAFVHFSHPSFSCCKSNLHSLRSAPAAIRF